MFQKVIGITFVFLFSAAGLFSQQAKIDSLRNSIPLLEGKEKVDAINDIVKGLIYSDANEATMFIEQAITLAEEMDYMEGMSMTMILQGMMYFNKDQVNEALSVLNEASNLAVTADYQYGIGYANLSLMAVNIRLNNYDKAIELCIIGIEMADKIGNLDLKVTNLMNFGAVKQMINELDEAKTYFLEAMEIAEANEGITKARLGQIYGNLGIIHGDNNDHGQALKFYTKALSLFREEGLELLVANTLLNLGHSHSALVDVEKATQNYDEAEAIWTEMGNLWSLSVILMSRGRLMNKVGRYKEAASFLMESLENEALLDDQILSEVYELLSKANEALLKPKKALKYYKLYVAKKDTLTILANRTDMAKLTAQFEFERLEDQNEIKDLRISEKNQLLFISIVVMLLIVSWSLWIRSRLNRKLTISRNDVRVASEEAQVRSKGFQTEKDKLLKYAKELQEKNKGLDEKRLELEAQIVDNGSEQKEIDLLIEKLHSAIRNEKDWTAFNLYFEAIYPGFFTTIKKRVNSKLTLQDQRMLALIKINLSNQEVADIVGITKESVVRAKHRLKQKFQLSDGDRLEEFLAKD